MEAKEKIEEVISSLEETEIDNLIKEELIDILNEALELKNKESIIDKLEEFIYELDNSNIDEQLKEEISYEIEEIIDLLSH